MKIDLNKNTRCISMSPWRQCFMRRIFRERGLTMPPVTHPIIPEKPTRPKEPKAYSSLALTFIRLILEAERDGLPYLIIYEDDAYPCAAPQETLDKLLAEHPLPADCGLLCLVSMWKKNCWTKKVNSIWNRPDLLPTFTENILHRAKKLAASAILSANAQIQRKKHQLKKRVNKPFFRKQEKKFSCF